MHFCTLVFHIRLTHLCVITFLDVPISDRFPWVEVSQVAIGMGDLEVGFQRVGGLAPIYGGLIPPMLFNTLSAVWFNAGFILKICKEQ